VKRWSWMTMLLAVVLTHAAFALPVLAAATPTTAPEPFVQRLWTAQGLMHPVVVHFPIAMIIGAAIAVVLRLVIRSISPAVVYYCLVIGAMGAIVSTLAGWAWAPARGYGDLWDMESEIFWHRWGGVIVTILAMAVAMWATYRIRKPESKQVGWQIAVVVLAAMIGLVGHQGGEMVYPNNLSKFWATLTGEKRTSPPPTLADAAATAQPATAAPSADAAPTKPTPSPATAAAANNAVDEPGRDTTGLGSGPAIAAPPPTDADPAADTVSFVADVWPILESKCIKCHGQDKSKGKFRMDTEELALKGGSSDEPAYIKGNPRESLMIKLITTEDELDRMPPVDEAEPVTPRELQTLVKWIEQGAAWGPVPNGAAAQQRPAPRNGG